MLFPLGGKSGIGSMIGDLSLSVSTNGELEQSGKPGRPTWHARGPQESQAQEASPKLYKGAVDFP